MPYKVVKDTDACPADKPWAVKKKSDDKLIGCHRSRDSATRQIAAIEANESKHRIREGIRLAGEDWLRSQHAQ